MENPSFLAPILPVMLKYGVTCSADDFQRTVNLVFHRAESEVYDRIHRCMWDSLPQQFSILSRDVMLAGLPSREKLALVDIGCGTGLASDVLLKTPLGAKIGEVHLLDTSAEMLAQARNRAKQWLVKTTVIEGGIEDLARSESRYDIVLACSVLHHIPDLAAFFRHVRAVQAPNGVVLHLQDPNGDYMNDPALHRRRAELAKVSDPVAPTWLRRFHPRRVVERLRRMGTGQSPHQYIQRVNDELLAMGVITTPMSDDDIWKITDIHDHDGRGISMNELRSFLPGYELISARSYSFFGPMASELPRKLRRQEEELVGAQAPNGSRIAGIWRLRSQ